MPVVNQATDLPAQYKTPQPAQAPMLLHATHETHPRVLNALGYYRPSALLNRYAAFAIVQVCHILLCAGTTILPFASSDGGTLKCSSLPSTSISRL